MPLAEGEPSLAGKPDWQPLLSASVPHSSGVYWIGLRRDGKVVPLYHGQASHLDERVADHRRALEGRGPDTPGVYWGLFLAAQVGAVVVRWEETVEPKEAEARELSSRNYAFNCNANGGYRIKAGLQAVGISPAEVQEAWAKLAKL
ncbi:hypothetical protein CHLRE_01g054350v5 [Chlamydomonas reinhardtii]|uniref:GIY-YIG domain-containing protein n=1 Tax=Chlamydomonas reinhardtii TaxID=3055 RepID=A8HNR1_CHLRE|nr:uncharacterized protein CHLRE_01g054350v5 [Chlamydomonas reinhardtii]PNW89005.1 hypothetical protein CHLRE_01g054350v5 [Chlamydomonas reinhardtii]|eukprot:XP_001689809.1 predicted protein [Chlamydomonas reinhardtii]